MLVLSALEGLGKNWGKPEEPGPWMGKSAHRDRLRDRGFPKRQGDRSRVCVRASARVCVWGAAVLVMGLWER